jgi:hypothetical protein
LYTAASLGVVLLVELLAEWIEDVGYGYLEPTIPVDCSEVT